MILCIFNLKLGTPKILKFIRPCLKLGSQAVLNVLESRRSAAMSMQSIYDYNDVSLRLNPADVFSGRSQGVPPQQGYQTPPRALPSSEPAQQVLHTSQHVPLTPVPASNPIPEP